MVTVGARGWGMLGAPRPSSAHGRRGVGGARRLPAPPPAGVAVVGVGAGRTWPHSGFHVATAVWVPEDDRAFATRLARYSARNSVGLEWLTYDRTAQAVMYRSVKSEAPMAGTATVDPDAGDPGRDTRRAVTRTRRPARPLTVPDGP